MQDLVSKQQDKKQQLEKTQKTIISSGTVYGRLSSEPIHSVFPRKLSFLKPDHAASEKMGVGEGGKRRFFLRPYTPPTSAF